MVEGRGFAAVRLASLFGIFFEGLGALALLLLLVPSALLSAALMPLLLKTLS